MIRSILLLLFCIFVLPVNAQQRMKLEVIPLKNSTSEQVINVIRPLLVQGGSISGRNNQLIIKTTPQNLIEIKDILNSID
jgi:type II secretory pathway component GspD/PulD (secretin)